MTAIRILDVNLDADYWLVDSQSDDYGRFTIRVPRTFTSGVGLRSATPQDFKNVLQNMLQTFQQQAVDNMKLDSLRSQYVGVILNV